MYKTCFALLDYLSKYYTGTCTLTGTGFRIGANTGISTGISKTYH